MAKELLPTEVMTKTLEKMVQDSGKSYREIAREANKMGSDVSLWSILSVAKSDSDRIKVLASVDKYILTVLDVLHFSVKDLIVRMAEEVQSQRPSNTTTWVSPDIREFMEDPDAKPYIELAYTRYQRDKLEKKQKELENKLNKK